MQINNVPGLTIHEHEGQLSGSFELSSVDLAAIKFDGRVMLAIIADVGAPFRVTTTKDGTHLAHWTFKAVEAAIVRDEDMRRRIAGTLHMDEVGSVDPHPLDKGGQLALEGVYDDEGAFLGFEEADKTMSEVWDENPQLAEAAEGLFEESEKLETFFKDEARTDVPRPVLIPAGGSKDPALERFLYDN